MNRPLQLPDPWRGVLVPSPPFPVASEAARAELAERVSQAAAELNMGTLPTQETFLQLWNLAPGNGGAILQQHVQTWQPEFGMGIWPLREPPQGWTETSLMDNAASVLLGEEPEMPNHRVLRLAAKPQVQKEAASLLRGCGTLIQMEARTDWPAILQTARELYLPRIVEARFRSEDFYFPLLDAATVSAARSLEEMDTWMCGISCYTRESAEDNGVLLVSRVVPTGV